MLGAHRAGTGVRRVRYQPWVQNLKGAKTLSNQEKYYLNAIVLKIKLNAKRSMTNKLPRF